MLSSLKSPPRSSPPFRSADHDHNI
jgi:hypothetical protein